MSDGFLGRERVFGGRSERGIAYSHDEKIPHLVKMRREVLKLLPDDIPDSAKGAETIKRVLGSLGTVAQGRDPRDRNAVGRLTGTIGRLDLVQAGWPVDVLFRIAVRSINGIQAGTRNRLIGQPEDPRFGKLLDALRRLQQKGHIGVRMVLLALSETGGGPAVPALTISTGP